IQFPSEPSVIKCGYDGLAGPGGGDDQVAPAAMSMPFNGKVVQHLLLKRVRPDVQEGDVNRGARGPRSSDGLVEVLTVSFRQIGLEVAVRPVGLEGRRELVQDVGSGDPRCAHIPLEPVYERRPGKVRRANPRRVETGVPLKQPCLGMKTGGAGVVRNLYLSAVLNQPIECATFS